MNNILKRSVRIFWGQIDYYHIFSSRHTYALPPYQNFLLLTNFKFAISFPSRRSRSALQTNTHQPRTSPPYIASLSSRWAFHFTSFHCSRLESGSISKVYFFCLSPALHKNFPSIFSSALSVAECYPHLASKHHIENKNKSARSNHTLSSTYIAKVQPRASCPYSKVFRDSAITVCFSSSLLRLVPHDNASLRAPRPQINIEQISKLHLFISIHRERSNARSLPVF